LKQKAETPFNPDQVNLHPILEKDSKNRVITRSQALEAQEKANLNSDSESDTEDTSKPQNMNKITQKRKVTFQNDDTTQQIVDLQ